MAIKQPVLPLVVPTARPTADFHRQANACAGRTTTNKAPADLAGAFGLTCAMPAFAYLPDKPITSL